MSRLEGVLERLDQYVERRTQATRTPGMAVACTDRETLLRVLPYGVTDLEAQTPVRPDTLFEIGSISKTFASVAVLQAVEAGLLDLHAPVIEYLPWWCVQSNYEPITLHHLLSHSSGLVSSLDFAPDPRGAVWAARQTQVGFAPGTHFHYSEVGYQTLTLVLEAVRGQPIGEIIKAGILDPLGMDATEAAIRHEIRPRMAKGYQYLYDDRPPCASHPLVPAAWLELNSGDGCIASTVEDMAKFARMLLKRGRGPQGDILSEASYRLMTQPVVDGWDYGYGILAFSERGFACIGHAGDMPGYEAYLWLDVDGGLGMAMLATRPYPGGLSWTVFQALRAAYLGEPLPDLTVSDPLQVPDAAAFAGRYEKDGRALSISAEGNRLLLDCGGQRIALEQRGTDCFFVNHPEFDRYLLRFARLPEGAESGSVAEAFHGPDWYVAERYSGVRSFEYPQGWDAYPGHYRAHNPWQSNFRVILRKGNLVLIEPEGEEQLLIPLGNGEFRLGEDQFSPERLCFDQIVDGQALRACLSGHDYYRFFTP